MESSYISALLLGCNADLLVAGRSYLCRSIRSNCAVIVYRFNLTSFLASIFVVSQRIRLNMDHTIKSRSRHFNGSNLLAIIAMGIGSIGYGYSANVISPIFVFPSFNKYFDLETRSNGSAILACMTSMYYVGGTIAAFGIGFLAERYGQKWAIAASAIITLISGALLAGSVDASMFIVFRFFSAAGGNMLSATVPIWMAEVVPAKNRGLLVDTHGVMYVFGYMAAAWVGYGFYYLDSDNSWRAPFGMLHIKPCRREF